MPVEHPFLIIEDDENDILLIKRALRKNGVTLPIQIVRSGIEALAYLKGEGEFNNRVLFPFPSFIITDVKMPVSGGFDVLAWLKTHPECSVVPVIVLSSSTEEGDIKTAYELGANAYFAKPHDVQDSETLFKMILEFWARAEKPRPTGCR